MLYCAAVCLCAGVAQCGEDLEVQRGVSGRFGGQLVLAQRAEPKTLNPVFALDAPSREVIRRMTADLITINRETQRTEAALAKSWSVSADGRHYTLHLRHGIRFSDGHAFDSADVVFTFQVHLDEKVESPQRDLLLIGGRPLQVTALDPWTVRVDLAQPHAAAERLFDSIGILPRHLLEKSYRDGSLRKAWGLGVPPAQIAGLGPFRLKQYVPGQKAVLERNPYYWKSDSAGRRLPFADELVFVFAANEEAQFLRFLSGETQIVQRIGARNYQAASADARAKGLRLVDAGPSLEYNFLFFNLNAVDAGKLPQVAAHQRWFQQAEFRRAISLALDRTAMVQVIYDGRATALGGHVTPANRLWADASIHAPARNLDEAKELLRRAGFAWNSAGKLMDRTGTPVDFSILASSSSTERVQMASMIQEDLKALGITVQVVPFDFRAMLDRILKTYDYDAAVLGLGGGDTDPNSEINVWTSSGSTHVWDLTRATASTPWQQEIDRLMKEQIVALRPAERKQLYDRVQQIVAKELPAICLVTPHVLAGAQESVGNFRPVVMDHSTLWNVEQLYLRQKPVSSQQGSSH